MDTFVTFCVDRQLDQRHGEHLRGNRGRSGVPKYQNVAKGASFFVRYAMMDRLNYVANIPKRACKTRWCMYHKCRCWTVNEASGQEETLRHRSPVFATAHNLNRPTRRAALSHPFPHKEVQRTIAKSAIEKFYT